MSATLPADSFDVGMDALSGLPGRIENCGGYRFFDALSTPNQKVEGGVETLTGFTGGNNQSRCLRGADGLTAC